MGLLDFILPKRQISLPSKPESTIVKTMTSDIDLVKGVPAADLKAYYEAPLRLLDSMGYKDKPASLSYDLLQQMSTRNAVISAIIATRVNQVSTFTKPARYSRDNMGYEIRLRDPNAIPDDSQREIMLALEVFLENCGYTDDPHRDDFDTFIRKLVRDTLTYDQMCFEIVPDRKGRPAEFIAVDASTIRAASEDYIPENTQLKKGQEVSWVQVIDGSIQAWFTSSELAFGVRNPRTNIYVQPYGFSELEQLIHQITSHLYAEEYNSRFFSQGGTTKGIINIKQDPGIANQEQLEAFKRQWRMQVSGLTGAWKTPVLQVPEGIEYLNVSQSNREMEFEKWMNYLINIACAVYQIDPAEVNFPNNGGVAGTGGSIFDTSNEGKVRNSKDKGLRPLLRFIETIINKYLIARFSQAFVFNFVGMDAKTEKEMIDLDSQASRVYKTVNEIRKEHDMEPLENGDTILDPAFVNMYIQTQMAQQMAGMSGGAEDEDLDNEDYDEDDYDEDDYDEDDYDFGWEDTDIDEEFLDEEGESENDAIEKSENIMKIYID